MAIVISFLLSYFYLWSVGEITDVLFFPIFLFGFCVAFVGFVDDHHFLTVKVRLVVHIASVSGALYWFGSLPSVPWINDSIDLGSIGYLLYGFSLIWFLNLYNFMDGIDGLAAIETIFISLSVAVMLNTAGGNIGLVISLLTLALASIGFLVWNWPPAKIFMGDGCSGFLGFVLGFFAIITSCTEHINIWTWLILSGYFVVDATLTLFVRYFRGENIGESHRSHAYQILSRKYQSHAKVTLGVLVLNIVWLLPFAILSVTYPLFGFLFVAVSLVPLGAILIKAGAGTTND